MDALEALQEQIDEWCKTGQHELVKELLTKTQGMEYNSNLKIVWIMLSACEQEKAHDQQTVFEKSAGLQDILDRFTRLKFYLRRIEFDMIDDALVEFYQFLVNNQVSSYELLTVMNCSVINKEKVLQFINREVQR